MAWLVAGGRSSESSAPDTSPASGSADEAPDDAAPAAPAEPAPSADQEASAEPEPPAGTVPTAGPAEVTVTVDADGSVRVREVVQWVAAGRTRLPLAVPPLDALEGIDEVPTPQVEDLEARVGGEDLEVRQDASRDDAWTVGPPEDATEVVLEYVVTDAVTTDADGDPVLVLAPLSAPTTLASGARWTVSGDTVNEVTCSPGGEPCAVETEAGWVVEPDGMNRAVLVSADLDEA